MARRRLIWALCGPTVFTVLVWFGEALFGLSGEALTVLAIATWMALWWVTEPVPLAVTALLPLVLFPATGILNVREASAPYADHIIFLFLGGFLIAGAVESSGLHRRIALRLVSLTGRSPSRIVGGFMVAGAFLSMWISNTATAIMMLPVALAVATRLGEKLEDKDGARRFQKALLLGIAYSTSIGGVGTLIGTPPNLVMAAAIEETLQRPIDFASWLLVGVPLVLVMLPLAWLYLTRVGFPLPKGGAGAAQEHLKKELKSLGPLSAAEQLVLVVFTITALGWIFRASKQLGPVWVPGLDLIMPGIKDSTIAIAGAILLFVLPGGRLNAPPVVTWEAAKKVPWGVILLFGGGLCLAKAFIDSGLAEAFAAGIASIGSVSVFVMVGVVIVGTVALTEFTSNTATASMLMPLLAATAIASGFDPLGMMVAGAVACSFAFCLPVATPPNAVVYGSGKLTIQEMVRAGIAMNLLAALIWFVLFFAIGAPLLGVDPGTNTSSTP